jgi:uncharacterized protein (UPF0335 family)
MSDTGIDYDALRSYADRVIHLHEERDTLNGDIREVYKEAKDGGFDTTILREIVRELRMESDARHSRYALLDSYRDALGMLADMPLGAAAMERAAEPARRRRGRPRKAASVDLEFDTEPAGAA